MPSTAQAKRTDYEVIIVGGGPAGLNAALILGRCRRRVLLIDSGNPRNAVSRGVHGFLTRDGERPSEMRRIGREQLRSYETVEIRDGEICEAKCPDDWFEVREPGDGLLSARKLLLATGLLDDIPDISGFAELYGHATAGSIGIGQSRRRRNDTHTKARSRPGSWSAEAARCF
jgi:thioredoxin reductase